jgi:2'-5' RNA ligase
MPAHITVLFPFLPEPRLTAEVRTELHAICAGCDPFTVTFSATGRFPGVLHLDPNPADDLRRLTLAIATQWPEAPPYGGRHEDVVPHLTVAMAEDPALDVVETELAFRLPVETTLDRAQLCVFDGNRWQVQDALPFHGAPDPS